MNKIPENALKIELEANQQYSICTCEGSKNLPFCDNMHRQINLVKGTSYKSVKIYCDKNKQVHLYSNNWPKKEKK